MSMLRLSLAATVAVASLVAPALADDRIHVTPPLFREQARPTAEVRRADELATVPRPVALTVPAGQVSAGRPVTVAAAR